MNFHGFLTKWKSYAKNFKNFTRTEVWLKFNSYIFNKFWEFQSNELLEKIHSYPVNIHIFDHRIEFILEPISGRNCTHICRHSSLLILIVEIPLQPMIEWIFLEPMIGWNSNQIDEHFFIMKKNHKKVQDYMCKDSQCQIQTLTHKFHSNRLLNEISLIFSKVIFLSENPFLNENHLFEISWEKINILIKK